MTGSSGKSDDRKNKGSEAEKKAREFLERKGYITLEQNWRAGRLGEVDLIMQDGDCLVFVEVRLRRNETLGVAEESVGQAKMKKLRALAAAYLKGKYSGELYSRFDVVGMTVDRNGEFVIKHIENAFY